MDSVILREIIVHIYIIITVQLSDISGVKAYAVEPVHHLRYDIFQLHF